MNFNNFGFSTNNDEKTVSFEYKSNIERLRNIIEERKRSQ